MPDPIDHPRDHLFVIGGARSGKSAFAQRHVEARVARDRLAPIFVATAEAYDDEMGARIAAHVAARVVDPGAPWRTIEAPYELAETVAEQAAPGRIVLVDCLTLWLSNRLLRGDDIEAASDALLASLAGAGGPVVLVSNEVGFGIVPDNALARRFRDAQGRLNQAVAAVCGSVVLVAAGLPLVLKGSSSITDARA